MSGSWGSWTTLEADDIEQTESPETTGNDVRGGTAPYWTGDSNGVEAIVQSAEGTVPEDVRLTLIDPGTSAADTLPRAPAPQDQAGAATFMPDIVTRAQWGADESIRTWDPEYAPTIKAATIHHTADGNNYTAAQVPAMMRSIYAFHTQTRGWGDIGYNVIVDKYGRIFEGRYGGLSSTVVGAHAGGFNTGTFGVSMLGNYAEVDTPAAMLESIAQVIAWKLAMYGVNPNGYTQLTSGGGGTSRYAAGAVVTLPTIFAHRDVGSTTCPGQYAYDRMGQIRDLVAARTPAPGGSPVGSLEVMGLNGNQLVLSGWVFDPDFPPGGIAVAVDVDGSRAATLVATGARADVAASYPQAGPDHGFSASVPLAVGNRRVCVYFLNASSSGRDVWVTCRIVTVSAAPPASQLGDNPVGAMEDIRAAGRGVTLTGWAFDPNTPTSPVDVHVWVDGAYSGLFPADRPRSDVGARYAGIGAAHGFSATVPIATPGQHQVCGYAINKAAGTVNPLLGCRTVDVAASAWDPQGNLETASVAGTQLRVTGWAYDVDTPSTPSAVHVFVDGAYAKTLTAGGSRPDVAAVFPGSGDRHGYEGTVFVGAGRHSVCAFSINSGFGTANTLVGCRWVDMPAAASEPTGGPDVLAPTREGVVVSGWAIDPDALGTAIDVHVYVDGRGFGRAVAGEDRPDVGAAFTEAGPRHGFRLPVSLVPGRHEVCVFAINVGPGVTNPRLGCRTVTV
ncbi:peptidoglycan recognition protein family protein [Klenkia terrae]|uniref:peptidoglycan recognition protein family protein n=1 Tax=Klenkia terrae TaxID=1052259 RepID=UPI001CD91085|nr:peptidoglycan recognition protein [Klenkia terrae]